MPSSMQCRHGGGKMVITMVVVETRFGVLTGNPDNLGFKVLAHGGGGYAAFGDRPFYMVVVVHAAL